MMDIQPKVQALDRYQLEAILLAYCFEVYERETDQELREAVQTNLDAEIMDLETIEAIVQE